MATKQSSQQLAKQAALGESNARTQVNKIAAPLIEYHTQKYCKRFCKENRLLYKCTLPKPQFGAPTQATLCEWGNASYLWMLDDLTNEKRLEKFTGENGAKLDDYLYIIANSLPFYERWKDWRFGRRVHVPTYIQAINEHAKAIFYALRQGDSLPLIAQLVGAAEVVVENTVRKIVIELTQRNRLYLLSADKTQSLTDQPNDDSDTTSDRDIPCHADNIVDNLASTEDKQRLKLAWDKLSAVEQYILEAMLIDDIDANDILKALHRLNLQLSPKIAAADTDRQQLYYFKRKTMVKLRELLQENE